MSLLINLPRTTGDEIVVGADYRPHRHSAEQSVGRGSAGSGSLVHVIASVGGNAQRKGRVQSAIAALFRAQPDRVFTAVDLAQAIHGESTRTTCKTIRRAADGVAEQMGWMRRRMWGRVDYVRPETLNRITRTRAERAAQQFAAGYHG